MIISINSREEDRLKAHARRENQLRSGKLMSYLLIGYIALGLLLSFRYGTTMITSVEGAICLLAFFYAKKMFPNSDLYQYIHCAIFGIFMCQYIYHPNGLLEVYLFGLIGSVTLIPYQNWKLQLPLAGVVLIHYTILNQIQLAWGVKMQVSQLDKLYKAILNIRLLQSFCFF